MRVPLSWLAEFVSLALVPEALAERLTLLGMEVKGIERIGADWQRVVVGELLEVAPHPGSGRLSLTRVSVGEGEPVLGIVCGATNIAAGQRVPVALPGSVLPGGRRIEVTSIGGAESQGMLCSGHELGLTDDAEGILILDAGTPVGRALADIVGDVVLDVDVKPNRGDALSIVGLAREVAAATGSALRWPAVEVAESGEATADRLAVEIADRSLCTRFVGRRVDGVTVGPSPIDVQRRLVAAGVRPISNVVDASNYVMLELGKPIHTFDAAAVRGGRIIVRLARAGERLETLDHVVRELTPDTLLIADPEGPLAIAGVMGGAASEVSEATRDVIIESAIFDPLSIRRTAFRYALRSEASLRFEKGQEHLLARLGADRTAQLILRWAGGRASAGVVDTDPLEPTPARIGFRPSRVARLLGEAIPAAEMRALLGRVGIATEPASAKDSVPLIAAEPPLALEPADLAEALVAVVPSHRRDLHIEADVAEEVARVRGYESLAGRLPDTPMPAYRPDPRLLEDGLRELLAGRGLSEVVTHGLIGPADHARMGLAPDDRATVRVTNPVTIDHSQLRRSMLPEHLRVLADNERQRREDLRIFELGPLHRWAGGQALEEPRLGILMAGSRQPVAHDQPPATVDVAEAKGLLEWLVGRLGEARLRWEAVEPRAGIDHPGRTGGVSATLPDGTSVPLGRVGELHRGLLDGLDVRADHVVFAEVDLAALRRLVPGRRRAGTLERLPAVERDLAVVVEEDRPAGEVEAVIREACGPRLHELRLFDRYSGPPLAGGELSLAYRLRFEPTDQPLEDAKLDSLIEGVVGALWERLGARLRA